MAKFCSECGAQLTGGQFCPECGAPIGTTPKQTNIPAQSQQQIFTQPANSQQPYQPMYGQSSYGNVPTNPIAPAPKKNKNKGCGIAIGILAILVVFFIFILAIAGSDDTDGESTSPKQSVSQTTTEEATIEVSVEQILKEYEENEVSADNKYKGKKVAITGIVDSVGKDVFDDTYIKIGTGAQYEAFGAQCYIADTQFERTAELKPGDRITVVGYVRDYSLNVVLKDCEIQ